MAEKKRSSFFKSEFTPACFSPPSDGHFSGRQVRLFLTSLVPRELFPRAVTWNSGTFQLASVAGPALGGALIALLKRYADHPAAFIYALNFLAAMTCFLCMKSVRARHVVTNPEPMSLRSFATGFRFIFAQRLILGIITLDMFAVFLGGATALLPVYAKDILIRRRRWTRIVAGRAAAGFGALRAHPGAPAAHAKGRARVAVGVAAFGLATIAFGLSDGSGFPSPCCFCAGRWTM